MKNYACILTEEEIAKKTGINKRVSSSIDNLYILDDNEYNLLYAYFLYVGCANNFVWKFTGICYLLLLYERNPIRFINNFSSAFEIAYTSVDSSEFYEDFYELESMLKICDKDVYQKFLKISCKSLNEEIKEYVSNELVVSISCDTDSDFYKICMNEYIEFKRKLGM
ncbi:MAG: hypothetical protein NC235_15215 [Clostridiales bacterium]|nr:hypothetical protein [Alistipes senegalensis]MCM1363216.1 hypothetical protein [Clostridiales bacterium]